MLKVLGFSSSRSAVFRKIAMVLSKLAKVETEIPFTLGPWSVLSPEQVRITFPNGSICDRIISSFMLLIQYIILNP